MAQKECNTYDQWFQKNEGQNKQMSIIAYKIPKRWHHARSLILIKAFGFYGRFSWGNVIFKICHFCLKSHNWRTENFHCLAPRVKCLLLLCKTKTAWIKRSIHYVIPQCYNPGKALKEIPPYLNRDFWYKRSTFWKWHCFRKMALESKRLHQNHWSWCHFAGRRIFYAFMHSLIWSSPWFPWN